MSRIGYMCGVDFQEELSFSNIQVPIYTTVEELKSKRSCWESCGIVKVKVEIEEWIVEQDFLKGIKDE